MCLTRRKWGAIAGSFIGIPTTFTLEVLGAAGAVWGVTDLMQWRGDGDSDSNYCRYTALFVGTLALLRYGAKFATESAKINRQGHTFRAAFWHGVVSPHEALKDAWNAKKYTVLIASSPPG